MTLPTVTDYQDRPVLVGTRVRYFDTDDHRAEQDLGTVTGITEWDADVDDDGRSIVNPPEVVVLWDDGAEESYVTSEWETEWVGVGPDVYREPTTGRVEELVVVTPLE